MKNLKSILLGSLLAVSSGCSVYVGTPGAVVVEGHVDVGAPAVEVVPVTYVWDGYEYVGEVNGGFYYFGPNGYWIRCDDVVLGRFHGWERIHPDWRVHDVIRNEGAYRIDRAHRVAAAHMEHRAAPARQHARPAEERKPAPATHPANSQQHSAPQHKPAQEDDKKHDHE